MSAAIEHEQHPDFCGWHVDQLAAQCDCGAVGGPPRFMLFVDGIAVDVADVRLPAIEFVGQLLDHRMDISQDRLEVEIVGWGERPRFAQSFPDWPFGDRPPAAFCNTPRTHPRGPFEKGGR